MLVIPAMDILDGKVVRLVKGEFDSVTTYSSTLVKVVEKFVEAGFNRLHIVDLSGARERKPRIMNLVREIKSLFPVEIQSGGGVRTLDDALRVLESGVDFLVAGSISVKNRDIFEKITSEIGANAIISASDSRDGMIAVDGWESTSVIRLEDQISYCRSLGINSFLVTDISKDGTLEGTNLSLYKKLVKDFPGIFLIASGGVKDKTDLQQLKESNVPSVVVGKAYYENKITLEEMKDAC
ncbi:MAG: 1-(5-phosphoribosyl)-5-[(5-phosphoribosylamino)methylideneamino]imidazole-4-carboxamide isomerase [Ignavibacteria bacterium]|nr:1-(5-phosphoribosyl)-5-[(5-phosphoribosylamino)methylideneamino]imidazole-4-carboxamide isomerase [Ignavibacteria bacterium]